MFFVAIIIIILPMQKSFKKLGFFLLFINKIIAFLKQ